MDKNKLAVDVVYRNEKLVPVYEKKYSLEEYTLMLRNDILAIITDVENMVYELNGNKTRREWTDESWKEFCKIKHKLLDKAGDVGRLPDNLIFSNECSCRENSYDHKAYSGLTEDGR